jgi:uncharacterized protein DUF4129
MSNAFRLSLSTLDLRRELRLALLAAMEACWVYAILVFATGLIHVPAPSTPLTLFAVYWIGLIVGRELPRRKAQWTLLQSLSILIAVVVLLLVARIELYGELDWFDFGWMPRYFRALLFTEGFSRSIIVTIAALYVYIRGLGFGSRPLTLWFVGFQFRIGVVAFFIVLIASAIYNPIDVSRWIVAYFFLSLLSISLARLDEVGSDLHYGPRWAITLVSGVALVIFFGLEMIQLFTLDAATMFLSLFSPLIFVAGLILLVIAIPASYLAAFLVDILHPLFAGLSTLAKDLSQAMPQFNKSDVDQIAAFFAFLAPVVSVLKVLAIVGVILTIGHLIARTLHRWVEKNEAETYEREALESEDETMRARREFQPKKKPLLQRKGQIAGETIRRIYAAMVQRAEQAGLPRQVAETPYEFSPRLQKVWREQSGDVRSITEAYVAVHYAEHEATGEEVSRVRAAWYRLRREEDNVKK